MMAPIIPSGRRRQGAEARASDWRMDEVSTGKSGPSASTVCSRSLLCSATFASALFVTYARVDQAVGEVDEQADDHQVECAVNRHDHDHRIVLELDRIKGPGAEAGQPHDALQDDRTAQQASELETGER